MDLFEIKIYRNTEMYILYTELIITSSDQTSSAAGQYICWEECGERESCVS